LCFSKSEQRQRRGEVAGFWEKLTEQLGQDQTRRIRHEQNRHSGVALSPCVKLFVHWFVILQRATLSFFGTSSVQLSERKSGAPLPKRHETKHLSLYSHSSRFKSSLPDQSFLESINDEHKKRDFGASFGRSALPSPASCPFLASTRLGVSMPRSSWRN
jgi:hypothetical protein